MTHRNAPNVILEIRPSLRTLNDLESPVRGLLETVLGALARNLLQELWRTAGVADSAARNESKGVKSMLSTRNP